MLAYILIIYADMYRESYFLAEPSMPNMWITMIATIRPTNPCEPKLFTMLEMLPITSPIRIFEPNRMFAKIPNPMRPTNIVTIHLQMI